MSASFFGQLPDGDSGTPLAERVVAQLYGRVYLWSFSWPIFWQHPIVGSGWGAYQLLYLDFQGKFLAAHPEYVGYWTNNRLAAQRSTAIASGNRSYRVCGIRLGSVEIRAGGAEREAQSLRHVASLCALPRA